jgi:multicomponent Na+:H+ antiporter subunit E
VITPHLKSRPGIVAVPLDPRLTSDAQLTLLANLISLTPGTLSLALSEDRRILYVHAMFVEDPDQVREEIKNGMEKWVVAATV